MPLAFIESGIKHRIKQFIAFKDTSVKELVGKRELNHRTLSEQLTEPTTKLGYCLIYLLADKYEDLSLRWLLTGEGEMIKDTKLKKKADRMEKRISEQEYVIEIQKKLIDQLEKNAI
jgi:hypothetical protein